MTNTHKTGPKDVFGQLLSIIWLYVLVFSFGTLLFGLINYYFPDVLNRDYGQYARESLKWPLAILVIVFPLYLWLVSYLQKDLEKNPEKKELKVRKWLLYFTIFLTAIAIVVDLITLIYRFLNGDLTTQFILKVLSVLAIALTVFAYYLWNIMKDIPAAKHPKMKWFVRSVVVVGGFFIVFGFAISGSPSGERMKRFDEKRVSDLSSIQYEITNYWQAKQKLPQTIDELRNDIKGFIPPKDPETGEAYEYRALGENKFELCAVFKTANKDTSLAGGMDRPMTVPYAAYPMYDENWQHEAGRACFSRTIDPDLYPPLQKPTPVL